MSIIEVPDELRPAFEDALNRRCVVCRDPVREHVSTAKCPCCVRGTRLPSEVMEEAVEAVEAVHASMKGRR
ncbi:MAG TPA: hypothetical protein VGG32_01110 [Thermoplasmata archaeon]|jgi:hypothetical protein